jgi:hypothetical protein
MNFLNPTAFSGKLSIFFYLPRILFYFVFVTFTIPTGSQKPFCFNYDQIKNASDCLVPHPIDFLPHCLSIFIILAHIHIQPPIIFIIIDANNFLIGREVA